MYICCRKGERCVRLLFTLLFYSVAAVPKLLERIFLFELVFLVDQLLLQAWRQLLSGVLVGVFFSYCVILPLASYSSSGYPAVLCSGFVLFYVWIAGLFVSSLLVERGVVSRVELLCGSRSKVFFVETSSACAGLMIGLSLAFQMSVVERVAVELHKPFYEWCKITDVVPMYFVVVVVFCSGCLSGIASVSRRRSSELRTSDRYI